MTPQLDRTTYQDRYNEGQAAHAQGDPFDSCPYDMYGGVEERFGYRYWGKGWSETRSAAEGQAQQLEEASTGQ
ncbi:hypothetical protein ACFWCA_19510 [Streptomyces phaeochromogenes]|uniref:hypothetical protein n=1 Tax=Streptomyces phaeochromogenes TaxID=1923 RepID=UPI003682663B